MITHGMILRFFLYGTVFLLGMAALYVLTTDQAEPSVARSIWVGLAIGSIITTAAWWAAGREQ